MTTDWYQKAHEAATRIDPAHTAPWKLATTYAVLSIAESLRTGPAAYSPGAHSDESCCSSDTSDVCRQAGAIATNGRSEILTLLEVAEMTRTNPATLRYWRSVGGCGPRSFKLGRRVLYRRADVEQWIADAHGS
ncbi:putative DNA-binding transcriptional regulator AlpA [Mycolicibacterium sp. BK634]|uniref:helix-turn-helix transcriptional regulator n=1 Tax=Mycolicibacterium sp. BK634 TaxID=2587099 RepID=UPI00185BFB71|nr:putative DNA-binding transcriptional regulator AlpA [Mycolicibacterium sp. BK634]